MVASGADFIVRVGCASLRLRGADRSPLAWSALFASLAPGQVVEHQVVVEQAGRGGKRHPVLCEARLIVCALPPAARQRAERQARRKHQKCRARSAMRPLTLSSTGFLMVLTSLPPTVSAAEVLAAYRLRWQVELAFKRLKSLLGLDRLPERSADLARSWLLAHLILALLIDDATQDLLDSPPVRAATRRRDMRSASFKASMRLRADAPPLPAMSNAVP